MKTYLGFPPTKDFTDGFLLLLIFKRFIPSGYVLIGIPLVGFSDISHFNGNYDTTLVVIRNINTIVAHNIIKATTLL